MSQKLKHGHFQAIEDCFIHISTLIVRAWISNCKTHFKYANQHHSSTHVMTTIKKTDQNRLFGEILGLPVEFLSNNTSTYLC